MAETVRPAITVSRPMRIRVAREWPDWALPMALVALVFFGLALYGLILLQNVNQQLAALPAAEQRFTEASQQLRLLAQEQADTAAALRAAATESAPAETQRLLRDIDTQLTAMAEQVDKTLGLAGTVGDQLRQVNARIGSDSALLQRLDQRLGRTNEQLAETTRQLEQTVVLLRSSREQLRQPGATEATPSRRIDQDL
ncbi:MAG: hypothetical protein HY320_00515 [Armatimonadetes bacterium]|nr:hypothetical protein [Armatimonadota bacterium]